MAPPSASSRSPDRTSGAARGGRWRAVLRFAGAVMAMSGALLLADVAVTLLWQEPVSALLAAREQDTLERRLSAETRRFTPVGEPPQSAGRPARDALARAARSFGARLRTGDAFGRVAMPTLGTVLRRRRGHRCGDAAHRSRPLRRAAGLPGLRKTVALAGHRTTYGAPFADVDELESGDPIVVTMPYGRFTYRVERQPDRRARARCWVTRARQRAPRADDVPPAVQRGAANRRVRALDR